MQFVPGIDASTTLRARLLAVALVVVTCATCGDFVSDPEQVNVALPAQEELIALIRGVGDVSSRIAPALGDANARVSIGSALEKLTSRLNAADGPGADRALADARSAVASYRASGSMSVEDPPELSAIDIALDRVDGQLKRLCTRTANPSVATGAFKGTASVVSNQSQACVAQ